MRNILNCSVIWYWPQTISGGKFFDAKTDRRHADGNGSLCRFRCRIMQVQPVMTVDMLLCDIVACTLIGAGAQSNRKCA